MSHEHFCIYVSVCLSVCLSTYHVYIINSLRVHIVCDRLADARSKRDAQALAKSSGGDGGGSGSDSISTPSISPGSTSQEQTEQHPLQAGTVTPEFTDQTVAIIARIVSAGNVKNKEGQTEDS